MMSVTMLGELLSGSHLTYYCYFYLSYSSKQAKYHLHDEQLFVSHEQSNTNTLTQPQHSNTNDTIRTEILPESCHVRAYE